MSLTETVCPLLQLPADIHFSIINVLDFPSIQNLRATNQYFRYLLNEKQLSLARKQYVSVLVKAESDDWRDNTRFICYECFQWKPWTDFGKKQISKKRSKGHADVYKRFCIDCGIGRRKWQPGQILKSEDGDLVLCRLCRLLRETNDEARLKGICSVCAESDRGQLEGSASGQKKEVMNRHAALSHW
jgi:hypothetical protein